MDIKDIYDIKKRAEHCKKCLGEESDSLDELSYWDNGHRITLVDVYITKIREDEVELVLDNGMEMKIDIEDIDEWS